MDTYTEFELPEDFQGVTSQNIREHIDHCLSTLRIAITCSSDVTPILLERDEENPRSVEGDFHTMHMCRNFSKIQEWFKQNSYTDWDCIQKGGIDCDIVPDRYKRHGK